MIIVTRKVSEPKKTKPEKVTSFPLSAKRSSRPNTAKAAPLPHKTSPLVFETRQEDIPSIRSVLKTLAKAITARALKLGLPKWHLPKLDLPALTLPNLAPLKQTLVKVLSRISEAQKKRKKTPRVRVQMPKPQINTELVCDDQGLDDGFESFEEEWGRYDQYRDVIHIMIRPSWRQSFIKWHIRVVFLEFTHDGILLSKPVKWPRYRQKGLMDKLLDSEEWKKNAKRFDRQHVKGFRIISRPETTGDPMSWVIVMDYGPKTIDITWDHKVGTPKAFWYEEHATECLARIDRGFKRPLVAPSRPAPAVTSKPKAEEKALPPF